jgi:nicotinamide mononucleotide adenylyltransferase
MKNEPKYVAFAAMRMQSAIHFGHHRLITKMIEENDLVIIGLGSTQIERTSKNPLTAAERIEMINILYGYKNPKIKIVKLIDKGAVEKKVWVDYCMQKIDELKLPTPTEYYAGSETDALWFQDAVNLKGEPINVNILDRYSSGIMSGTEVRASLANETSEWKKHVPRCLHDYIEKTFPKEQTLQFNIDNKNN